MHTSKTKVSANGAFIIQNSWHVPAGIGEKRYLIFDFNRFSQLFGNMNKGLCSFSVCSLWRQISVFTAWVDLILNQFEKTKMFY